MSLMKLSSLEPITFEYECYFGTWGTLGTIYRCNVKNEVNLLSQNESEVQNVTGTHQDGYNNDNVVGFSINNNGQIHFFPRGLTKFFKNLKGIQIARTGLKEIHQNDLKEFPELVNLHLWSSDLEIVEANLFKFNPKLDFVNLNDNKISHIDPLAFEGLAKMKSLSLWNNSCIDMGTSKNLTAVQSILKLAEVQCVNSDYSKLDQQVKDLKDQSKNLNSATLKKTLENLENQVKNSNFFNFFQQELQELKAIQAKRVKQEEIMDTILAFQGIIKIDTCSSLEVKLAKVEGQIEEIQQKNDENFKNDGMKDNVAKILDFIEKLDQKMTAFESKLTEIDSTQKKLIKKFQFENL